MGIQLIREYGFYALAGAIVLSLYLYYHFSRKHHTSPEESLKTQANTLLGILLVLSGLIVYQHLDNQWTDQRIIDRFHILSYNDANTWGSNTWFGVKAEQNPNDAWIHQEIIWEVKPDFIIEAGTLCGGSAALWATVLQHANPEGRVITIDIEDSDGPLKDAMKLPIIQQRVDFLRGRSSTDPEVVAEVTRRVKGKKVLVILDSLHTKEHVLNEIKAYSPLVNVGSYIIVQDTNINGHPVLVGFGPGPMEAVDEFLTTTDQFVPDKWRERLIFTMYPKGYLKRVK
jgi:cephalosporin hydroxylase